MRSVWKDPLLDSRDPEVPRYPRAPRGWVTALILLASLGGTAVLFTARAREARLLDDLDAGGRTTVGHVTKLDTRRRRSSRTCTARYEYSVDGRRYEWGEDVPSGRFAKLHVGDAVTVTYLPSDPARAVAGTVAQARRDADDDRVRFIVICVVFWVALLGQVYVRMRNSDFPFRTVRYWYE